MNLRISDFSKAGNMLTLAFVLSIGMAAPNFALSETALLWNFSVIAIAPVDMLSDPALDKSPSTGKRQVAFSKRSPAWFGGGAVSPWIDSPGVYLQEVSGSLTTIAEPGDQTPDGPSGYVFCSYEHCASDYQNHRVSLSQGSVAFIAMSYNPADSASGPLTGIYIGDGAKRTRVADTTMLMPSGGGKFQSFGFAPSIDSGNVVFKGVGENSFEGIFGDFGNGLVSIADMNSPLGLGYERPTRFTSFGEAPMLTSTDFGSDIVAFHAAVVAGPQNNIHGVYTSRSVDNSQTWGIDFVADSWSTFPYNRTGFTSPSIDFSGDTAFNAETHSESSNPTGIYSGRSADPANCCPQKVATTGSITPDSPPDKVETFLRFGYFPSSDATPKLSGVQAIQHWVGFVAETTDSTGAGDSGVYLHHDTDVPPSSALYRVVSRQGVLDFLAPILGFDPTLSLRTSFNLFHNALKDGAIAFRVSIEGDVNKDAIILAELCAMSLNANVTVHRGGWRINRSTKHYLQQLTLKNESDTPIAGPLALGLNNLSKTATLANGTDSCGQPATPYVTLDLGSDQTLNPGETISVLLDFNNPTNQSITYASRVLWIAPHQ